jgi:predicted ferric reductase
MSVPWTWLLIRASGITAWVLLTTVVAYGILLRTRLLGSGVKPLALLNGHRWLGALALVFLTGHLALLLADPYLRFTVPDLLIPFMSLWKPTEVAFGIAAVWVMAAVAVLGRLRVRLGKQGNTSFRRAHLLAYLAWPLATAHYVLAGTDALTIWSLALLAGSATVLVFLLLARGHVPHPSRPGSGDSRRTAHVSSPGVSPIPAGVGPLPGPVREPAEV